MLERFTWNWCFFFVSVLLCLQSAYGIKSGIVDPEMVFYLVLGLVCLGFFTNAIINEKPKTTIVQKKVLSTDEAEEEVWRSYCVKKE